MPGLSSFASPLPTGSAAGSILALVPRVSRISKRKSRRVHAVTVEVGREQWSRKTSVFIKKDEFQVLTGPDGTAHLRVPAGNDSMALRGISRDSHGRQIVAQAWAYVEGSPARAEMNRGSLKLVLDRKRYAAGDHSRALIQTDMPGGKALVCVELDRVRWRQVVALTSPTTIVEVPIEKEYAPNAYISVDYIHEKHYLRAQRRVNIDRVDRDLHIDVKTDRDIYKPGDVARVTVRTVDSAGKPIPADVSLGVVDEGIYAVAEESTDIKQGFYPSRSNEVRTEYSFPRIYLDGGDKGSSKIPLRKLFRDTAAWVPSVWTGPSGIATTTVKLPDNLTQWRVTAVGISDDTLVGMQTAKFRARKDLMIRLELPQFLVDRDQQVMSAVVSNDTGVDQDVRVRLDGAGITVADAGLRSVHVPNGIPQVLQYHIAGDGPGKATLSGRAWVDRGAGLSDPGLSDGVQQSFTVEPRGRPVTDGTSGEGSANLTLPIRPSAHPTYGSLEISVSPTLAGGLVPTLDGLIGFPYGCVEQTMSRFLPSVLVAKTVKDLHLPPTKHLSDLPLIVRDSLARLNKMRHADGAWGWWDYDESSPFMTALVLDGLDRANLAGWDVSEVSLSRTLDWGLERLKAQRATRLAATKALPKPRPGRRPRKAASAPSLDHLRDRLYLVYSLLRHGKWDAAADLEGLPWKDMTASELATAALAFHAAGQSAEADRALGLLRESAQGSEGLAYWPSEPEAWGQEPSALALVAFETIHPTDPLVPRIVRHLMISRKGNLWESTRDSAYAIVGLTAYLEQSRELSAPTEARILVNGREVKALKLDPKIVSNSDWTVQIPRSELGKKNAHVEIRSDGPGKCYYSVQLKTLDTTPVLAAESTDPGLRVERRYYRLEARRLENGEMHLLPGKQTVTSFQSGDLVRVELTITSKQWRDFVLIEEPTPASCRVTEREDLGEYEEWNWWWSRTVILDDHLAYFATSLPKGESKISYTMRAEQAGKVCALPTTVANMYDPVRYASSAEADLEVK